MFKHKFVHALEQYIILQMNETDRYQSHEHLEEYLPNWFPLEGGWV